MLTNRCAACLLLTTTGRILVQWELDATLPLRYTQLALLVASLVQFSKAQDFCELELSNGHTLVVRSDAAAQLSCAIVCTTGSAERKQQTQKVLDMAHLKSLVILTEFLRCYRDDVEALVEASRASVEDMAEKYTLTSALAGGDPHHDSHYDSLGGSDADGTLDAFIAFQNDFVAPMIEDNSAENIRAGISDSVAHVSAAAVEITRQFLVHADSGRLLYSLMAAPKILSQQQSRHRCVEESLTTQHLLTRLARALSASFPILQRTSLLTRSRRDSNVGFANASVSSTTVVLRLQDPTVATSAAPAATGLHIAVQMLSVRASRLPLTLSVQVLTLSYRHLSLVDWDVCVRRLLLRRESELPRPRE